MDAKQTELLKQIATATAASGFGMFNKNTNAIKALVAAGLVELNPAQTKGMDIAARATEAGIAALNGNNATTNEQGTNAMNATTNPAVAAVASFAILDGITLPPRATGRAGGGKRASKYPFAQLEIGKSFFVPKSEDMKNPARSLASTASAQSVGTTKRYAVRTYTHEGVEGALVQRIADAAEVMQPKPRKAAEAPAS